MADTGSNERCVRDAEATPAKRVWATPHVILGEVEADTEALLDFSHFHHFLGS